jgi:RES domain-containing protein
MLDEQHLPNVIANITPIPLSGTAYRDINLKYLLKKIEKAVIFDGSLALSAIGSFKNGGRYNLKEVFEALYLADNPQNALLEVKAIRETAIGLQGVSKPPHLLLSVEYNLKNVIDLTDTATHKILGTNFAELKASWQDLNADGIKAPTQILGKVLYEFKNIEAIKVPSAYVDGAYNLNIFPDRLMDRSFVRVSDHEGYINICL